MCPYEKSPLAAENIFQFHSLHLECINLDNQNIVRYSLKMKVAVYNDLGVLYQTCKHSCSLFFLSKYQYTSNLMSRTEKFFLLRC